MSIPKKSLISNRVAVKKALIASQPPEVSGDNPLKASSLTAQSMKRKKLFAHKALKGFTAGAFKKI
jgi:hypothetical protein